MTQPETPVTKGGTDTEAPVAAGPTPPTPTTVVVGSVVGTGGFSPPSRSARGAGPAGTLIAWAVTGKLAVARAVVGNGKPTVARAVAGVGMGRPTRVRTAAGTGTGKLTVFRRISVRGPRSGRGRPRGLRREPRGTRPQGLPRPAGRGDPAGDRPRVPRGGGRERALPARPAA